MIDLKIEDGIDNKSNKKNQACGALSKLSLNMLKSIYRALIQSYLRYGISVLGSRHKQRLTH